MQIALRAEHHSAFFENTDERFVGVFEEQTFDRFDVIDEVSVQAHGMDDRQIVSLTQREIVDAVCGCCVHDARATFRANEVGRENLKCSRCIDADVREQLFVARADQFCAFYGFRHGMFNVPEHSFTQRFGNDERLALGFAEAVVDIVADSQCQI